MSKVDGEDENAKCILHIFVDNCTGLRCLHYTTGLPTKYETSETTVWNLYCLYPFIHDSLFCCKS